MMREIEKTLQKGRPDARSAIRHHLVLYRRDPEQGRARFFSLMVERDLFGTIRLVRNWGLVSSKG
jgi:predicted DNA-binding WGR domain protein